ncbi:MAG: hypothetical protein QNK19_04015 [Xanthomonadales bacterium]|nr:hypothetical protein [Xanthomonadales bacterium]
MVNILREADNERSIKNNEEMGNKRVSVTGASCHIGANLVRELPGRGYRVVVILLNISPIFFPTLKPDDTTG